MSETKPSTPSRQKLRARWAYYRRVFAAYVLGGTSQLTFWHGVPQINEAATVNKLGQYYMPFTYKASYPGPFDNGGVPLLDYRGHIGRQYNPIAIAQYGLAHYNQFKQTGKSSHRETFLRQAKWLVEHLEHNPWGIPVWNHQFDWEYRKVLKAPWYSGLAQGQGISLLLRAYMEDGDPGFLDGAHQAFQAFLCPSDHGGVTYQWPDGDIWFEEYLMDPPSHILNGFIWALWGIYDYALSVRTQEARNLLDRATKSLVHRLPSFDVGYWSLYDLSHPRRLKMLSSPFYHKLHIVQLRVTQKLTGESILGNYADQWEAYAHSRWRRTRALVGKVLFKLLYY